MLRYKLRTLLILLAIGPPVLAGAWWTYQDYCQQQRRVADQVLQILDHRGIVPLRLLLELRDHQTVIPLLANDTLAHWPPLTFFRGLVLNMDGAQHDSFEIGEAVVSPLANAARVFALAKRRLTPASTLARLETAQLNYPDGAAIIRQAADAFRIGLYYQTLAGGARIEPGKIGKFDQLLLKTAFSSIQQFLQFTVSTFIPRL
jgi:signal-transduction protein with cAMP-binding, CBS, and nucleotidyltransferase domain